MADVRRSIFEGATRGLIAGAVFALALVAATVIAGESPIVTFRLLASVLLGPAALATTPAATVVGVGLFGHLFLATIFGMFYGAYSSALTPRTRRSVRRQAVIGPLFGVMVWLVTFVLVARTYAPWLLELPQPLIAALHAAGYGLPLGLLYATAERRRAAPTPAHA